MIPCPENDELLEGKGLLEKTLCRRAFTNKKIVKWSGVSQERIS
jgi:hypothetical protein